MCEMLDGNEMEARLWLNEWHLLVAPDTLRWTACNGPEFHSVTRRRCLGEADSAVALQVDLLGAQKAGAVPFADATVSTVVLPGSTGEAVRVMDGVRGDHLFRVPAVTPEASAQRR